MSSNDPMDQFYTPSEQESPYLLYTILGISLPLPGTSDTSKSKPNSNSESKPRWKDITQETIKKHYRKSAVRCHPDKHAGKDEREREGWVREFQRVGFAFAVLGDESRRARYDSTGRTSEVSSDDIGEGMEWATYFERVFTKVDKRMLDEDRVRYQGSKEETDDLYEAYRKTRGDLDRMMSHIPHSTTEDETRFKVLIDSGIEDGSIGWLDRWDKTSKSVKGKRRRVDVERGEAEEAEEHAKVLGIWEEMYGDGAGAGTGAGASTKAGTSKSKAIDKDPKFKDKRAKRNLPDEEEEGEEGGARGDSMSGLAAMIAKRQGARESAMNALLDKYSQPPAVKRSKRK